MSLSAFRQAYAELLTQLEGYPAALADQPNACGWWSPRQIVAHLSGWVAEADIRFRQIAGGDTRNLRYDWDSFNAQSVQARAHLDWTQTVADLRLTVEQFIRQVEDLSPETLAADRRYRDWIPGLTNDCREHMQQLRDFLERR